jgi:CBS-domain-containing membrane protein
MNAAKPPAGIREILLSGLGGALAIALVAWLTVSTGQPLLMAPFGASCFLMFVVPDNPVARPRNVIGGHLVSALVGMAVLVLAGSAWWAMGLGVGLAIVAMRLTHTNHPPAASDPLLIMLSPLGPPGWGLLLTPVLVGALLVVAMAVAFNRLRPGVRYPQRWF